MSCSNPGFRPTIEFISNGKPDFPTGKPRAAECLPQLKSPGTFGTKIWDVSKNRGEKPQNGWFIMVPNLIKLDDLGVFPYFWKATHIGTWIRQRVGKNHKAQSLLQSGESRCGRGKAHFLKGFFRHIF